MCAVAACRLLLFGVYFVRYMEPNKFIFEHSNTPKMERKKEKWKTENGKIAGRMCGCVRRKSTPFTLPQHIVHCALYDQKQQHRAYAKCFTIHRSEVANERTRSERVECVCVCVLAEQAARTFCTFLKHSKRQL